jgi:hypothetical protein
MLAFAEAMTAFAEVIPGQDAAHQVLQLWQDYQMCPLS